MDKRLTMEQVRKLQSQLAAEEMKLTIMKQMRQSQRTDPREDFPGGKSASQSQQHKQEMGQLEQHQQEIGGHSSGSLSRQRHDQLQPAPPPLQPTYRSSTAQRSYQSSPPSSKVASTAVHEYSSSSRHHHHQQMQPRSATHAPYPSQSTTYPRHHDRYRQSPSSSRQRYNDPTARMDYAAHDARLPQSDRGRSVSQPDLSSEQAMDCVPPPPLLQHVHRAGGRRVESSGSHSAPLPSMDAPPSLLPSSQVPMERDHHLHGQTSSQMGGAPSLKQQQHDSIRDMPSYHHRQSPNSLSRGRSNQVAKSHHQHVPAAHSRVDYANQRPSTYRPGDARDMRAHALPVNASAPDAPQGGTWHQVAKRMGQLIEDREQYIRRGHIPNKPPQYTWSLVPTAAPATILGLIGMDECVRRVELAMANLPPPDPERLAQTHRPVCAHCKADFAQFWRSFEEDNKMVIVCENCDWARVKRPFVMQHTARLKESLHKVDAINEEMEELQVKSGVTLVKMDQGPGR
eukprot:scpid71691/ scgid12761/ Transcriptional repressor p66 alpha; GATA zinc finger domain-containing protein 2A